MKGGGEDALCFEHFLPWIYNIMLAYPEQKDDGNDLFPFRITVVFPKLIIRKS